MKNIIIVLLIFLTSTGSSCLKNAFAKRELKTTSDNILYSIVCLFAAAIVLAVSGGMQPVSSETLLLSIVFGVLVATEQIVGNEAYRHGSMSLTNLMADGGLILTIAFACIVWKETLTPLRAVGVLLMLLAMVLIVDPKAAAGEKSSEKQTARRVNWIWILLSLLLFVLCGTLGIIQKMLAVSGHSDEISGFLFYNFIIATAVTVLYLLYNVKVRHEPVTVKFFGNRGKLFLSSVFSGLCNSLLHITTMLAVGALPATVAFPIIDGGKLFLVTVMDVFLFKQKLTRTQIAGLVLAIAAIAILA